MRTWCAGLALALLVAGCGGDDVSSTTFADAPTESTPSDTTAPPTAAVESATTASGSATVDLAPPCSYVVAAEASTILGTDVTASEDYGTDCFYEPSAGGGEGRMDAHLSFVGTHPTTCLEVLEIGSSLEDATTEEGGYGDASLITDNASATEIQVCVDTVYIFLGVYGDDLTDSGSTRVAAESFADMILDRL